MLLAIDIGNTNITFGLFKKDTLIRSFDIPTYAYRFGTLKRKLPRTHINDIIICSVVPKATRILARDISKALKKRPLVAGRNIQVPLRNLYRYPKRLGSDRLVNAYAGACIYGAPLIVVDFGTAITFDVVSAQPAYLGGIILPGLKISLDALFEHAALLPRIKLKNPGEFIGRDTESSVLSGMIYGFSSLTDELVERIKRRIGKKARVIVTGGNSSLIFPYCKRLDKQDPLLTLKGLNLLYHAKTAKEN